MMDAIGRLFGFERRPATNAAPCPEVAQAMARNAEAAARLQAAVKTCFASDDVALAARSFDRREVPDV